MSEYISGIENELSKGYQSVKKFGSSLVEDTESVLTEVGTDLKKGVSFVGESAEKLYRGVAAVPEQPEHQLALQRGPSNLDKVTTQQEPSAPMAPAQPVEVRAKSPSRMQRVRSSGRKLLKTVVNWTILLLILVLIGVIVYLTCKRYSLVGTALNLGDRTMAAALLSPELSAGLSTLAATL